MHKESFNAYKLHKALYNASAANIKQCEQVSINFLEELTN